MTLVGKHSGPAPQHPGRGRRRRLALAALGTFLAWLVLVYLAIKIGGQVRSGGSGDSVAWVLLVIAVIGAICCLFLALQIAGRVLASTRAEAEAEAAHPHPVGGRRARR